MPVSMIISDNEPCEGMEGLICQYMGNVATIKKLFDPLLFYFISSLLSTFLRKEINPELR